MKTFLLVAAERRELEGFLRKIGKSSPMRWPGARFAREAEWRGDRWWFIANGPGPRNIDHALTHNKKVDAMISTGFCGALDPSLKLGDIIVASDAPLTKRKFTQGRIVSQDRVAVTPDEKQFLFKQTGGALAVEMESVTVRDNAAQWNVPFQCIRVVSDIASDTLPLDFNQYRKPLGDFSRSKIAAAALTQPFSVLPKLIRFERNCQQAARILGEFLADCRF